MNRKGSAILFVLIITAVCLPMVVFAWQTLFIQSKLNYNRLDMIQGELNVETEINKVFYDQEGINKSIIEIVKTKTAEIYNKDNKFTIPISSTLLDNPSAEVYFINGKTEKLDYKLKIMGDYKDISLSKTILGSVLNKEIDDCEDGLVYLQGKSQDYIDTIQDLLVSIPDAIDTKDLPAKHTLVRTASENLVNIKASLYTNSDLWFNNNQSSSIRIFDNNIILIVRSDGINRNSVLIDSSKDSNLVSKLSGIIYIENGDLIFKDACSFQGLVFIKDGDIIKEGQGKSTVLGKVITNSFKDPREAIDIKCGHTVYLKYAKHLPPLLDPRITKVGID